jgi:hypothetical protein
MNETSEWIKGIPLLVVFGLFVVFEFRRSAGEAAMKKAAQAAEDEKRAHVLADEAAESALVRDATSKLPDLDGAMQLLLSRYGWIELLELVSIGALSLDALRSIEYSDQGYIELPNLESSTPGKEERRVVNEAAELNRHNPHYWRDILDFGPEVSAQVPTVQHLRGLLTSGYVKTLQPIEPQRRQYQCALTEEGRGLLTLDWRFRKQSKWDKYWGKGPSQHVREEVSRLMYQAIKIAGQQSA